MPPICLPGGQFSFPRSYCQGLYVRHDPGTLSLVGNVLSFIVAGPPDALCKVYFDTRFVPWSSNRWTLDHLALNATYEYPPNPTIYSLPYYLSWEQLPGVASRFLLVDAMYGADYDIVDLPPAPGSYWLPPAIG